MQQRAAGRQAAAAALLRRTVRPHQQRQARHGQYPAGVAAALAALAALAAAGHQRASPWAARLARLQPCRSSPAIPQEPGHRQRAAPGGVEAVDAANVQHSRIPCSAWVVCTDRVGRLHGPRGICGTATTAGSGTASQANPTFPTKENNSLSTYHVVCATDLLTQPFDPAFDCRAAGLSRGLWPRDDAQVKGSFPNRTPSLSPPAQTLNQPPSPTHSPSHTQNEGCHPLRRPGPVG